MLVPGRNLNPLKISLTGMNNKSKKGKPNSQLSLSQSLLRKKTRKLASTNDTATNPAEETASNLQCCEENSLLIETKHSYSQPESNDFDDSFDLFLPRRSPKKCLVPKAPSSQSSFFEIKKTKKSRYFDESGQLQVPKVIKDDDLELAIAVSLQESKGSAVNLKPPKAVSGPVYKGKLKKACSQSLLMRRSAADRERIITEKVAIVLMNTNKISTPLPSGLESCEPRLLYSAFLNERFNTLNTLWNLSQADLTKISKARFYTNVLLPYVDSPFQDQPASHSGSSNEEEKDIKEESGDLQLVVSDEDMFGSSGDESYKGPSPKRPRSDESTSPHQENMLTSNLLDSHKRLSQGITANAGNLSAVSNPNISCKVLERANDAIYEGLSLQVEHSHIVTMETSDCHESPKESVDYSAKTPLKKVTASAASIDRNSSTRHSLGSSFVENDKDFTYSKHLHKLSADLTSLLRSDISGVTEIRKESETLYAHGCVVKARCPTLFDELVKNSGCLDEYSLAVCQAVFRYIYAADVGSALTLTLTEKKQLVECCLRFGLEELAEALFPTAEVEDKETIALSSAETNPLLTESPHEGMKCYDDVSCHASRLATLLMGSSDKTKTEEELPVSPDRTPKPGKELPDGPDKTPQPEKVHDVIVLDSDCCSAEEILSSEAPAEGVSEDELDLYLKDGIRFLEKNSCSTPSTPPPTVNQDAGGERGSPSKITTKEPKRSIEKYFQDSFPSLDGISVTPTPSHQSEQRTQTKGPTPCSSRGIMNCVTPGGQLVVSEQATPMPDYESMVSPDLKEALQKYGIKKGIGRRKAVTLLRYIYEQIHPPSDHPAVAKAIDDIKSTSHAGPPATNSDCDVYTLSSESSGDEEMFEDLGDVYHSQAESECQHSQNKPGLLREVGNYIKSHTLLYAAVLKYEPIWLNKFHLTLKENGIKCNEKELIEVLDELGITFRTATSSRRRTKKPTKRKE